MTIKAREQTFTSSQCNAIIFGKAMILLDRRILYLFLFEFFLPTTANRFFIKLNSFEKEINHPPPTQQQLLQLI